MNYREECIRFACADEMLFGVLARPEQPAGLGIVVVVGGPQTRVGSHRQFVLFSRTLAAAGYATLRFDVRGMGDSAGDPRNFEAVGPDIGAAIDTLQSNCPGVGKVVLWGLCDAASASLLYWHETRDPRIAGFCLLNPWVRSETTLARTQVKHYYGQRLMQKEFWLKLLRGQLNVGRAVAGLIGKLKAASAKVGGTDLGKLSFQERMAGALHGFSGRVLLILSENDYTAKEFLEYAGTAPEWKGILERENLQRIDIPGADHTFSSAASRANAANACRDWIEDSSVDPPAEKGGSA